MHERGLNMRNVGRLAMEASMNHTKELAVIEVVSRCAKLLIRDGLNVLQEEKRFTSENIKKCILHYIHEIFKVETKGVTTIWDFLTEHSRRKF